MQVPREYDIDWLCEQLEGKIQGDILYLEIDDNHAVDSVVLDWYNDGENLKVAVRHGHLLEFGLLEWQIVGLNTLDDIITDELDRKWLRTNS